MPWKQCSVMDERLRFVARLLDGETMSEVCRDFGISRKTGYKIFSRYREHGAEALTDRSRRPVQSIALIEVRDNVLRSCACAKPRTAVYRRLVDRRSCCNRTIRSIVPKTAVLLIRINQRAFTVAA